MIKENKSKLLGKISLNTMTKGNVLETEAYTKNTGSGIVTRYYVLI